jgi:Secretion system C-terminal sorting domain
MTIYKKKQFIILASITSFLLLSGTGVRVLMLDFDTDPIYKVQKIDIKALARLPVDRLLTNIKNGRWHLLDQSFADVATFNEFAQHFHIEYPAMPGGIFAQTLITFKTVSVTQQSKENKPDVIIIVQAQSALDVRNTVTFSCRSVYDNTGKQYYIEDVDYVGEITLAKGSEGGRLPAIPQINASVCKVNSISGFIYVRPRWRKNETSAIEPNVVLGDSPNENRETVPPDYYGTNAIKQEPFQGFTYSYPNPKWEACDKISPTVICDGLFDREITETYQPGYMLTQQDVIDANLTGILFSYISDAEGVLEVPYQNQLVPYPTGFFLDLGYRRMTVLTAKSEVIHYGREDGQHHFSRPVAVAVAGDFVYVLDKGDVAQLVMFRYGLNDRGKLELTFIGTANLGHDFTWVADISGYRGQDQNILYATDIHTQSIFRFSLDYRTGLLKAGSVAKEFARFTTSDGKLSELAIIEKIRVSPQSTNGNDILMVIQHYNEVATYSVNSNSPEPRLLLNYQYEMPMNSLPVNIGYNLGNNTFLVADYSEDKVHLFSGQGAYLGSGGKRGVSESNNELFYPAIISSNNFANDANEFIAAPTVWALDKGFKRFFPQADIGKIEVIEKTPVDFSDIRNSELIFRYALTAGQPISSIILKLNSQVIKTLTGPFYADYQGENFLVNGKGENGLAGKVNTGWNTYEVELTASIPGPSNANLQFKRTRSLQFYYTPSVINDSHLVISSDASADFAHNKTDNPFYIYKNMLVEGAGDFLISNGKTIIMPGCTLKIAKERMLLASNEDFELHCGANIEVNTAANTLKTFKDSYFNGLYINSNMVSCRGDYTGGQGSGSAPSSELEFISCRFNNYAGKAIHVIEGRATVASCTFENTINQVPSVEILTAAAIAVNPRARLDVRGGKFINNDIAIDGNGAELYIGHPVNSYKGVKLTAALFQGNQIALHSFNGYTEIRNCEFVKNFAAVLDLNGTLDLSKNSDNIFEENTQAVIFSNIAGGQSGQNRFVNNYVDISYVIPPGSISPIVFDFTCNYWQHDAITGTPVIDLISDPPYDVTSGLVKFTVTPYLERKGNSNYTCTGGKPGGRVADEATVAIEDLHAREPQTYHKEFSSMAAAQWVPADYYIEWKQAFERYEGSFVVGEYPNRWSIPNSYQQAMLKNGLFTYLYRAYRPDFAVNETNYKNAFRYMTDGVMRNTDHYINITFEKVAFARLFEKDKRKVLPPVVEYIDQENDLKVYPNPAREQVTVSFTADVDGVYAVNLYNIQGVMVKNMLISKECKAGILYDLPVDVRDVTEGLYFFKVHNNKSQSGMTVKWIKN